MQLHPELQKFFNKYEKELPKLDEHLITDEIRSLKNKLGIVHEPSFQAELLAFAFCENYKGEHGWNTYHGPVLVGQDADGNLIESPSLTLVTPEHMVYWQHRAVSATHPIMKNRYADLVWDFAKPLSQKRSVEMARTTIDSGLQIVELSVYTHELEAKVKLKRSLSVALSINDEDRMIKVRDAMMLHEEGIADNHSPGLWGYSLKEILGNTEKLKVDIELEQKILQTMEKRLKDVSIENGNNINLNSCKHAAIPLAQYYRKTDRRSDALRVLLIYKNTVMFAAPSLAPLAASHKLKEIYDILLDFGEKAEAEVLYKEIEKYDSETLETFQEFKYTYEVPVEEFNKYVEAMIDGTFEEAIARVAYYFLPNLEEEKSILQRNASEFPFSNIATVFLKDRTGRTVAKIESFHEDPEGRLVLSYAQNLYYQAFNLNEVIKALITKHEGSFVTQLMDYMYSNGIFEPANREIIQKALNLYIENEYLTSIHLLIPQIESTIRNFLDILGGQIYKPGEHSSLALKSLNTILDDELFQETLTERITYYLKVVLADKRGWNLRNEISHGLMTSDQMGYKQADRLFHIILLLAHVKQLPTTRDDS